MILANLVSQAYMKRPRYDGRQFQLADFAIACSRCFAAISYSRSEQSGWSRTVSCHYGRQACRLPSRVYRSRYTADRFSSMTNYCEVTVERIEPRHLG